MSILHSMLGLPDLLNAFLKFAYFKVYTLCCKVLLHASTIPVSYRVVSWPENLLGSSIQHSLPHPITLFNGLFIWLSLSLQFRICSVSTRVPSMRPNAQSSEDTLQVPVKCQSWKRFCCTYIQFKLCPCMTMEPALTPQERFCTSPTSSLAGHVLVWMNDTHIQLKLPACLLDPDRGTSSERVRMTGAIAQQMRESGQPWWKGEWHLMQRAKGTGNPEKLWLRGLPFKPTYYMTVLMLEIQHYHDAKESRHTLWISRRAGVGSWNWKSWPCLEIWLSSSYDFRSWENSTA